MTTRAGTPSGAPIGADVLIIGGGITGLWTRALLASEGYSVVLVDSQTLGDGQTSRSQGILHRGVKYAFSESARGASALLADVASVWDKALAGAGPINLSRARVLSASTYLWTVGGVLANLTAWSASKAMRSAVTELARDRFPPGFAGSPSPVRVWRVDEPVLDPASLLASVRDAGQGPLLHGVVTAIDDPPSADSATISLASHADPARSLSIRAPLVILCAGEGNESLLALATQGDPSVCQRRPLKMAMIDGAPFELFGHCPQPASDKPRITITTAARAGSRVWYVGGNVAEKGPSQSADEFRDSVRDELSASVPWADLSSARFDWLSIDRAEAKTATGARPDGPIVHRFGRVCAAWPTKLALAPQASAMLLDHARQAITRRQALLPHAAAQFPAIAVASLPWDPPPHGWSPLASTRSTS